MPQSPEANWNCGSRSTILAWVRPCWASMRSDSTGSPASAAPRAPPGPAAPVTAHSNRRKALEPSGFHQPLYSVPPGSFT